MLLPISTSRPLRHPPIANLAIIVITLIMFGVQETNEPVESLLLLRPDEPSLLGMLGSAFLHAGWGHLLGNLLFLYIFGNAVNDYLGHAGYVALYLGGAMGSALLHSSFEDNPALGASGAVSAISGAFLVFFPRARVNVFVFLVIITMVSVPALWFVGLFFLLDVWLGFGGSVLGQASGVANWGHVGGALYGFGTAFLLLRTRLVPRDSTDLLTILRRGRERKRDAAELRRSGQAHTSTFDIVPERETDRTFAKVQDLRNAINSAVDRGDNEAAAEDYRKLLEVDERQVLAHDTQLAVASQLYRDGYHADAAKAYRQYLSKYAAAEDLDVAQSRLFLGLLLGRYLGEADEAVSNLRRAGDLLANLGRDEDAAFARAEADRVMAG